MQIISELTHKEPTKDITINQSIIDEKFQLQNKECVVSFPPSVREAWICSTSHTFLCSNYRPFSQQQGVHWHFNAIKRHNWRQEMTLGKFHSFIVWEVWKKGSGDLNRITFMIIQYWYAFTIVCSNVKRDNENRYTVLPHYMWSHYFLRRTWLH